GVSGEFQPRSFSGARVYIKILAGPPAAKTRSIFLGTSTSRPAESTTVRLSAANASASTKPSTIMIKATIQLLFLHAMIETILTVTNHHHPAQGFPCFYRGS